MRNKQEGHQPQGEGVRAQRDVGQAFLKHRVYHSFFEIGLTRAAHPSRSACLERSRRIQASAAAARAHKTFVTSVIAENYRLNLRLLSTFELLASLWGGDYVSAVGLAAKWDA